MKSKAIGNNFFEKLPEITQSDNQNLLPIVERLVSKELPSVEQLVQATPILVKTYRTYGAKILDKIIETYNPDNNSDLILPIQIIEDFVFVNEYNAYNCNRPKSAPFICQSLQQGSDSQISDIVEKMTAYDENVGNFNYQQQLQIMERVSRPDLSRYPTLEQPLDLTPHTLVFYYRSKWINQWQGGDPILSSLILADLVDLLKQDKLAVFNKLIVIPRSDGDFPHLAKDLILKKYKLDTNVRSLSEYVSFDNNFEEYFNDPNANFVELFHGTPQRKPGVFGTVMYDELSYQRNVYNKGVVEVPIFWPDRVAMNNRILVHDEKHRIAGTIVNYFQQKLRQGYTNIPGIRQPVTFQELRQVLLDSVVKLDKFFSR